MRFVSACEKCRLIRIFWIKVEEFSDKDELYFLVLVRIVFFLEVHYGMVQDLDHHGRGHLFDCLFFFVGQVTEPGKRPLQLGLADGICLFPNGHNGWGNLHGTKP